MAGERQPCAWLWGQHLGVCFQDQYRVSMSLERQLLPLLVPSSAFYCSLTLGGWLLNLSGPPLPHFLNGKEVRVLGCVMMQGNGFLEAVRTGSW